MSPSTRTPILLSWSGGKDCLMALETLHADSAWQVMGLLTTVTARHQERVSMHGIRHDVLQAQAAALQLPLIKAVLEEPADGTAYERAHQQALEQAAARWPGLQHCAFGDLFLADVREYRERQLARAGWHGVFPLWQTPTDIAARRFIQHGHRALVVCVDTTQLNADFCGQDFDAAFVENLPAGVDPCGEHGEFHTLSYGGPLFAPSLTLTRGVSLLRDQRFQYTDFSLRSKPDTNAQQV